MTGDDDPTAGLTRRNLAERTLVTLRPPGRSGARVLLVDCGERRLVVKDFASRHPLRPAWLGRWLAAREAAVYQALGGLPWVPRLIGRLDAFALIVEHRAGARFSRRRPWTFSPAFGRELAEAVGALHARGVLHLDLRHRSNVRAGTDGRPVLIDFGSALRFRPGGLGARLLLPLLARVDRRALAKWQRRLGAQSLEAEGRGGGSGGRRGASRPT